MAKKMTKVGLSLACVAALGAAQLAPIAVPVFGTTLVKAEVEISPSLEVTHVVDRGTPEERELSYLYLLEPEDSVKIEPILLEGYSYIGIVNTGGPNDLSDAARDGLITYDEITNEWGKVILEYGKSNDTTPNSPEEAPTPPPTDNQPGQPTPPSPPSADEQPGQPTSPTPAPKTDGAEAGKEAAKPSTNPTSAQAVPATQESEKATSSSSKTLPNTGDVTVEPLALAGLGLFLASLGLRHLKKELD